MTVSICTCMPLTFIAFVSTIQCLTLLILASYLSIERATTHTAYTLININLTRFCYIDRNNIYKAYIVLIIVLIVLWNVFRCWVCRGGPDIYVCDMCHNCWRTSLCFRIGICSITSSQQKTIFFSFFLGTTATTSESRKRAQAVVGTGRGATFQIKCVVFGYSHT